MLVVEKGDVFVYSGGAGVAISNSMAVLVKGKGGRTGYVVLQDKIPEDVSLTDESQLNHEVQMAIEGALAAIT